MAYTEFLRVRRTLLIYTLVIAGLVILTLVLWSFSDAHHGIVIDGHTHHGGQHDQIPLSFLLAGSGYISAIVACILGSILGGERQHVALAWTKPVSRERFALTYLAVDVVAMCAAFLILLAFVVFTIWAMGFGSLLVLDARSGELLLLGLGFMFAFYGVVRALGTLFGRGGLIAGLTWPVGLVLASLAQFQLPNAFHYFLIALNFFNPLAYLVNLGSDRSVLPVSFDTRVACEWLLAIGTMAASIGIWKRLED